MSKDDWITVLDSMLIKAGSKFGINNLLNSVLSNCRNPNTDNSQVSKKISCSLIASVLCLLRSLYLFSLYVFEALILVSWQMVNSTTKAVLPFKITRSGRTEIKIFTTCLNLLPDKSAYREKLLSNFEESQPASNSKILLCLPVNLDRASGCLQFDNICLLVCTAPHKRQQLEAALFHLTKFASVGSCDWIAL